MSLFSISSNLLICSILLCSINMHCCLFVTARSTPSPVVPKLLTPLTPASSRKNKNKRNRPPSTDKQLAARTNQQRESWVVSPSPALGSAASERSRERSLSPGAGSPDHRSGAVSPRFGSAAERSVAVGHRSPSPTVGSQGQRSLRSNDADVQRASVLFSKRSSSSSDVQRGTMPTTTDQVSVVCYYLVFVDNIIL